MDSNATVFVILVAVIIFTIYIFYNTIITKKWRNLVENEKDSWKFIFIYYNPTDSRLFVPKRTGLGYTVNFGKPISIIILLVILVIGILYSISQGN